MQIEFPMQQKPQKFRVEVSEDLHRALKLSADLHHQDLRDYVAPHLWAAVDPKIRDLLDQESTDTWTK
jgi:predicted HicB family RNase H-like nuclease